MTCTRIQGGWICGPDGPYEYEGILFELHRYHGPHPIRRSGWDPWDRVPKKIWDIAERFMEEKDKDQFLLKS